MPPPGTGHSTVNENMPYLGCAPRVCREQSLEHPLRRNRPVLVTKALPRFSILVLLLPPPPPTLQDGASSLEISSGKRSVGASTPLSPDVGGPGVAYQKGVPRGGVSIAGRRAWGWRCRRGLSPQDARSASLLFSRISGRLIHFQYLTI